MESSVINFFCIQEFISHSKLKDNIDLNPFIININNLNGTGTLVAHDINETN